jgi:hypothetical protein
MSAATEILVLFMTDVEGSTSLWNDRKQKMLMRRGVAGKIMLSEAAAGVLRPDADLVLGTIT